MSKYKPVGYGNPPKEHRFKTGNQAASKQNRAKKKKANALSMPDIIDKVLRSKRRVKRGDQVYSVPVAEIVGERLVQMLTTGTARDVGIVMQLIERHLPDALSRTAETLEIIHHRAEGSTIAPPLDSLWDKTK